MEWHPVGMRVLLIRFLRVAHPAAEIAAPDGAHISIKNCFEIGAAQFPGRGREHRIPDDRRVLKRAFEAV